MSCPVENGRFWPKMKKKSYAGTVKPIELKFSLLTFLMVLYQDLMLKKKYGGFRHWSNFSPFRMSGPVENGRFWPKMKKKSYAGTVKPIELKFFLLTFLMVLYQDLMLKKKYGGFRHWSNFSPFRMSGPVEN